MIETSSLGNSQSVVLALRDLEAVVAQEVVVADSELEGEHEPRPWLSFSWHPKPTSCEGSLVSDLSSVLALGVQCPLQSYTEPQLSQRKDPSC